MGTRFYKDGHKLTLFKDDHQPLEYIKDSVNERHEGDYFSGIINGWNLESQQGSQMQFNNTYNAKFDELKTYGKSEQKQYIGDNVVDASSGIGKNFNSDFSIPRMYTFNLPPNKTIYPFIIFTDGTNLVGYTHFVVTFEGLSKPLYAPGNTYTQEEINSIRSIKFYGNNTSYAQLGDKTVAYIGITTNPNRYTYEPYVGGVPSPNPQYPQEIKSIENPMVEVSNADGTITQQHTFPYTLYGIPVDSGGNYTDESGQQWIADYVDVANKKLWHWCEERIITQNDIYGDVNVSSGRGINYMNFRVQAPYSTVAWKFNIGFSDIGFIVSAFDGAWVTDKGISFANRGSYGWIGNNDWKTKEEFLNALPITFIYKLDEPYSEDLTDEQLNYFKTYYPTTIVESSTGRTTAIVKTFE